MDHAGHLGLSPALLDMQGADNVGPALAAVGERPGQAANRVPPPEPPTEPGLSAEIVAEKPPPNEAV